MTAFLLLKAMSLSVIDMSFNSKLVSEFLFKNPDKASKIGSAYILSSFANFDYFQSLFCDSDIIDVCRFVSTLCYLCDDSICIVNNLSLDYQTANLSSIHSFIINFCDLVGKK